MPMIGRKWKFAGCLSEQFFLKATQLEQMKEQYDEANASKEKTILGIEQYEKVTL